MPEPLAVAFVEVRPEVDDFRSDLEQQVQASEAADIPIRSTVELEGIPEARREIEGLGRDLRSATSGGLQQQLQIEGLESATSEIDALADASGSLGTTLNDTATAASGVVDTANLLARSSRATRDILREEQQQLRATTLEEEKLVRVRSGRAIGLAGLRFAGIGLAAGTALFAGTRAVRELGEALAVTGDEAGTTEGRLRNLGSALLSGDIVGAFQALTDNTRTFSAAQLVLINQTPELADALRDLGEAGNIARSTAEALASLAEPPQFLQTALAREQAQGDIPGQIEALEQQLAFFKQAEDTARQIAQSAEQRNAILEPIFAAERRLKDQLADLRTGTTDTGARAGVSAAGASAADQLADELRNLNTEKEKLSRELPGADDAGTELADLRDRLESVNRKIEEETARVRSEQQRHVDEVNRSMRGDRAEHFEALEIAEVDRSELQALQRERAQLVAAIATKQVAADQLEGDKDRLRTVNEQIEAVQRELKEEQARHAEEMRAATLQRLRIDTLEAEVFGTPADERAALQAEAAAIEQQLANKNISADERERLLGQLRAINGRIEAAQRGLAAEAERHAREMEQAQADADQAFIDSLSDAQHDANRNRARIEASAQLTDDIRLSEELQAIFQRQIAAARKTIRDQKLKQDTIADLQDQLRDEEQNERSLRQQQRREQLDRREESLDLDIQLAAARDNRSAEIRAHQAKIEYLQERIRHTREGTNQRKRLRLEIAQERAEIKRLQEETKDAAEDQGASFDQLAADFLANLQGANANFASNVLPPGTQITRPAPTSEPEPVPRPPVRPAAARQAGDEVPSPFEQGRASGTRSQADVAQELRDARGAPQSQSQGAELIDLSRQTLRTLREIRTGLGHTEASNSRRLNRHSVEAGVD